MSELIALGASHKTAGVAVRERIALTEAARRALHARAGGRAGRSRGRRPLDLQPHRALPRGRRRRSRPRPPCSATSRGAPACGRPSCVEGIYSLRNCDAARHLYRVTSGLESMVDRRGRGPGPGQARVRGGAVGQVDRPADQQALPRRAGDRQARAHRHRDLRRPRVASPPSRSTPRATRSATSAARHVLIIGAGETAELTARALHAQGVRDDVRRQPPARAGDRAGAALRRRHGRVRRAARGAREGRHRRRLHLLAAPDPRRGGAGARDARSGPAGRCC